MTENHGTPDRAPPSRPAATATERRAPAPTRDDAQVPKPLPDIVGPGLEVLFCGINPGLKSAEVGHNFARPGNRFWPALHGAGFTPRLLRPEEDGELPRYGIGMTNLVSRPTASAAELTDAELRAGALELEALVTEYRPRVVAVVGLGAYRAAFRRPKATIGLQHDTIAGAPVWLLPNPSGLNTNHPLPQLIVLFIDLREWLEAGTSGSSR
jgi:double-stranded uracil-DNA glycosylase